MRRVCVLLILAACSGSGTTAPPAWRADLPPSSVMGGVRGLLPARGIIHLHSPYSHDACDGKPRGPTGAGPIDEACLADLRRGLCVTQMDFAALTDHDDTMADEDFQTLFLQRGGDTWAGPAASRLHCDDGHDVLLTVGGENDLMPIMLDRHVDGDAPTRHDTYNASDPAAVAAFRAAGATVWIPHTERFTADDLAPLTPDGIEVYQLHANLDPKIRPLLGLPPYDAINQVAEFADLDVTGPEPDLAFLAFVRPNAPSLAAWDGLLAKGLHVAGSGGTDAHQNVLALQLRDGERMDSYRRMMRWFSNVVLVADPTDPDQVEAALRAGRMFVAFEILGTPVGLDIHAEVPGGAPIELGGTVAASAGAHLSITPPSVAELDPSLPAPIESARVIRVTASGASVVAEGAGPLDVALDTPGAYRVEIDLVPRHLGPYLGTVRDKGYSEAALPWIYASPIYVE